MAATAGPLDRKCSSAVSVDIDPGWYEGQPETADAEEVLPPTPPAAAADHEPVKPTSQSLSTEASAGPAGAAAVPAGSHVPTVLTKLQKWGDYDSFGEPVWPTKFIPMKTPLSHEILDNWQLPEAPRHRLTVSTLLRAQHAAGRRVGLLLDLSNHDCLYDCDIPSDVQYRHVQLVAKELPPLEFVQEVARAANNFWAEHPDLYIAIHCAYGFNRTGFVVTSYLIEHCGLSVDQALASFAASRPPGVKHEKFRNELRARYGGSDGSAAASSIPLSVAAIKQQQQQQQPNSSSITGSYANLQLSPPSAAAAGGGTWGGRSSTRALSCRSCGSTSSSTAAGWLAGDSPGTGSAVELLLAGYSPSAPSYTSAAAVSAGEAAGGASGDAVGEAAAAAAATSIVAVETSGSPAMAAGTAVCPRCCCCNAELAPEDVAAAAAALGCSPEVSTAPSAAAAPRLLSHSSGNGSGNFAAMAAASSSFCSSFARVSTSGAGCGTPPPPPLPPNTLLTASSSSSKAILGSSPGLRLSGRCWSSNSVGDNSSIGCSPNSSTADLVTLRTSCLNSAHSSGLDSNTPHTPRGGRPDTPLTGYSPGVAPAAGQAGVGLGYGGVCGSGSADVTEEALCFKLLDRGSSGGGCSSSGAEGPCDRDEAADGSAAEEGCFEMDPGSELSPRSPVVTGSQHQQQLQEAQGGLTQQGFSQQRRKSVTFRDAVCCEQAAPSCSAVQQLPAAELDTLLASVSITQKQQTQPPQPQMQLPQQQYKSPNAVGDCSCSCHSEPQSAAGGVTAGPSIRDSSEQEADSSLGSGGSSHVLSERQGGEGAVGRSRYLSSEDGVPDPLENESFGKVTSTELLKHLRVLQRTYESNQNAASAVPAGVDAQQCGNV